MKAQIDAIISESASSSHGHGIVSQCASIFKVLKDSKLAYSSRLQPDLVGVHPANRDGYGINAPDVHTLLSDVMDVGLDHSQGQA